MAQPTAATGGAGYEENDVPLPVNCTAVAIDRDKNSQNALKWAVDNLLCGDPLFLVLIHVITRTSHNRSSIEADIQQLFTPYRGYCARKSIQIKEVVLEDPDVSKAILNYINSNYVSHIVIGAASRSFIKNFKKLDVPTSMLKSAPDFCSVYVVQKEKLLSVKSAQRPIINTAMPPKLPHAHSLGTPDSASLSSRASPVHPSMGSDRYMLEKSNIDNSRRRQYGNKICRHSSAPAATLDGYELSNKPRISSTRSSGSLCEDDPDDHMSFLSIDWTPQNADFSMPDANSCGSLHRKGSNLAPSDIEAEMRQLKLELKQTLDLYNSACKEAISAKHRAKELGERKMEEGKRLEQARIAEEAALAMVEKEKEKCRVAMEAAEAAKRLAKMESERRRQAEIKAKREADDKDKALTALAQHDTRYRRYTIDEIETATGRFAGENKVGEGGYGPVFKGTLDHTPVAIKVLRPDAAQGRKQFHQEVEVLSSMRHPNMVLLLGACPEYGCLVYEYMNNGSLEDRLLCRNSTPPIPWQLRFKISAEIVTALCFLHQAKPEPLVHRDLKPANILLDRNYVSKISDVGLARLVPPSVVDSVTQYHVTAAAGTFYYIDPEYQQSGVLTTKSDVYSLGIMLLQIVTGRTPMGLSHKVEKALQKGGLQKLLDPTVEDWPVEEALRFIRVALKCAELRKKDRPDLATEVLPELIKLRDFAMEDGRGVGGNVGGWSTVHSRSKSQPNSQEPTKPSTVRGSRSSEEGEKPSEEK